MSVGAQKRIVKIDQIERNEYCQNRQDPHQELPLAVLNDECRQEVAEKEQTNPPTAR